MPIRNGYQNTVSEGFTPVLGHVILYSRHPRKGANKTLWSAAWETSVLMSLVVFEFSSLKKRESNWCGFHVVCCLLTPQFSVHWAFYLYADCPVRASTVWDTSQSVARDHLLFIASFLLTLFFLPLSACFSGGMKITSGKCFHQLINDHLCLLSRPNSPSYGNIPEWR